MTNARLSPATYGRYVLFVAGMGGLLYGIDIGIIAAALGYIDQTISLSLAQTGAIVAAVLGGSLGGSLVAGVLADWLGRRTMMIVSGLLFVVSLVLIVLSTGFVPLFAARLLQGISGGVIAVVVPLYLAECLGAKVRGKGSAIFQLMITVGIVTASFVGLFFTTQAEHLIAANAGNTALIRLAQEHAWRGMFMTVILPGVIFFVGSFFLSETPRWLFRKGRENAALAALRRSSGEAEAQLEMREMRSITTAAQSARESSGGMPSLLRRRYLMPFALACVVLALNQATGINSILSYLVVILKQAGMTAEQATQGDLGVKLLNTLVTIIAVMLVDTKGRKFLLVLGTSGVVVALTCGALLFHSFEAKRIDIRQQVAAQVRGNTLDLDVAGGQPEAARIEGETATVLYSYGKGDLLATSTVGVDAHIHLQPEADALTHPLVIRDAYLTPPPGHLIGWAVVASLALFIASFAIGPGVVVWLALSELMPTRIRSTGMGIALVLNQGVSTVLAGIFLPVAGRYGYGPMFAFWAGCTVLYLLTAAFWLPETKGRTLEEIEAHFAGADAAA